MTATILRFHFVEDDTGAARVRLSTDTAGFPIVEAPFEFDRSPTGRLADVLRRIDIGDCNDEDLKDVGANLWSALMADEVGVRFRAIVKPLGNDELIELLIDLPERRSDSASGRARPIALDDLPWEALYDEHGIGFLASDTRYCVVRAPPRGVRLPPRTVRPDAPPSVLAIIPSGSGLNTDREWADLRHSFNRFLSVGRLDRITNDITPDRLREKLAEHRWDIVHFIGHGEVNEKGQFSLRISEGADGGFLLPADAFSAYFKSSPPRLLVVNCCGSARTGATDALSGLTLSLMQVGVSAVVAMRYDIRDDAAIGFSNAFYRELLRGVRPGRVKNATAVARYQLYLHQKTVRAFVTPALFCTDDTDLLFDFASDAVVSQPQPTLDRETVRPEATARQRIPKGLVAALRDGRCVPVVGPGSSNPAYRRPSSWSMQQLARVLADKVDYPHRSDLSEEILGCPWMAGFVLQSVCQFFENDRKDRYELVQEIRRHYENVDPPPIYEMLAAWKVPGYISTHFDGLLREALQRRGKDVNIIDGLEMPCIAGDNRPPLVLLRGRYDSLESLKLTLEDDDQLWDQLAPARLPSHISRLSREAGRSLLFLGFSPRDRFVRRLAGALAPSIKDKAQGPSFFICNRLADVDAGYWSSLRVQWIEGDAENLLAELTRIAQDGNS